MLNKILQKELKEFDEKFVTIDKNGKEIVDVYYIDDGLKAFISQAITNACKEIVKEKILELDLSKATIKHKDLDNRSYILAQKDLIQILDDSITNYK